MHGAAAALATAALGAEQFIHHFLRRQTLCKRVTMTAKCRGDPVIGAKCGADSHRSGFLTLALMDGAGHGAFEK